MALTDHPAGNEPGPAAEAAIGSPEQASFVARGDLIALARNPVPSGAQSGLFQGHDGAPLRYAIWDASLRPRRGTVCLFHGRGEFIEKYFETIADLRRRGFAVATFDWRGQGGSVRECKNARKGHTIDFRDHDRDLVSFMKNIVLPDCPPPFVAMAHSTGGNILLRNARMESSWFERIVATAPLIRLSQKVISSPVGRGTAEWLAELLCLVGLSEHFVPQGNEHLFEEMPFEGNPLTSDPERFRRNVQVLEAAPHLGIGSPTIGWLRAAFRSMRLVGDPDYARLIKVPAMLIAAGNDDIVSSRAVELMGQRLKVGSYLLIPESRHEILQERDEIRKQFWAAFDAYMTEAVRPV